MSTLAIAELVDACERMAAANRSLFEQLGAWVADEADPEWQQLFAVACHRHAWHADLWDERRPKVPLDASAAAPELPTAGGPRATWYRDRLAELHDQLAELEARLDPVLDPSTVRVIQLVAADLADLSTR